MDTTMSKWEGKIHLYFETTKYVPRPQRLQTSHKNQTPVLNKSCKKVIQTKSEKKDNNSYFENQA